MKFTRYSKFKGFDVSSLDLFVVTSQQKAQIADAKQSTIFEGDPLLLWRLKPNLDHLVWDFTVVSTNSEHLRSLDSLHSIIQKQPGTIRIVCLGDSVTFGYRVPAVWPDKPAEYDPEWLPYPMLLEKHLRERNPGRTIEVIRERSRCEIRQRICSTVVDGDLRLSTLAKSYVKADRARCWRDRCIHGCDAGRDNRDVDRIKCVGAVARAWRRNVKAELMDAGGDAQSRGSSDCEGRRRRCPVPRRGDPGRGRAVEVVGEAARLKSAENTTAAIGDGDLSLS